VVVQAILCLSLCSPVLAGSAVQIPNFICEKVSFSFGFGNVAFLDDETTPRKGQASGRVTAEGSLRGNEFYGKIDEKSGSGYHVAGTLRAEIEPDGSRIIELEVKYRSSGEGYQMDVYFKAVDIRCTLDGDSHLGEYLGYALSGADIAKSVKVVTAKGYYVAPLRDDKGHYIGTKKVQTKVLKPNFGVAPMGRPAQEPDEFGVSLWIARPTFWVQAYPVFPEIGRPRDGREGDVVAKYVGGDRKPLANKEVVFFFQWFPYPESIVLSLGKKHDEAPGTWSDFAEALKVKEELIIGLATTDEKGEARMNYLKEAIQPSELIGWLEDIPRPLEDIYIGAAVYRLVSDKIEIMEKSAAKIEIPGIARITEVSVHGEYEEIKGAERKVFVSRRGQDTKGEPVYDARYYLTGTRPSLSNATGEAVYDAKYYPPDKPGTCTPYYLFPLDAILMDKDDVVQLEWITGLRLAVKTKAAVVGDKLAVVGVGGKEILDKVSRELYKGTQSGWFATAFLGSAAMIASLGNPISAGILGGVQIVIWGLGAWKGEVPFVVTELHSTVVADFREDSATFYTLEGTNVLRDPNGGGGTEIKAGFKGSVASDGTFGTPARFSRDEITDEMQFMLQRLQTGEPEPSGALVALGASDSQQPAGDKVPVAREGGAEKARTTEADAAVELARQDKEADKKKQQEVTKQDSKVEAVPAEDKQIAPVAGKAVFEETFDKDNSGRGSLHHRGFSQWYVPVGEVDLLGNGFHDVCPGHGLYVDLTGTKMDGTGKTPGMLQSKQTLELAAGRYRLSFDLAGDGRGEGVKVSVWLGRLGSVYKRSFVGSQKAQFERKTAEFELGPDSRCRLSFVSEGAQGSVLVDNITLEKLGD
jgi:hypothetical protein